MDKRVQTTFRLSPELLKEFKHALLDRGEKMTPVIEGLIREWMYRRKVAVPLEQLDGLERSESNVLEDRSQTHPKSTDRPSSEITPALPPHNSKAEFQAGADSSIGGRNDDATIVGALALARDAQPAVVDPWVRILAFLEKKISSSSFEKWLKPTRFSHIVDRTLYVSAPSAKFEYVWGRYSDLIQEAIDKLGREFDDVSLVTMEERTPVVPVSKDIGSGHLPTQPPTAECADTGWSGARKFNARYTFDSFVTGNGNQFAQTAALAVAERPTGAYNPLFLYGGVGMGKTHLMHAIGQEAKRRQQTLSVCYISAERFTNELIHSLRYDHITSFRERFRSVDMLLIDDIQFIAQKERTQEEFFHTFNALHENMKQIVIASDRPPKELAHFEDRLRSRLEWGLIADIQPPDLETKVAILLKKAAIERVELPTEVAVFVATNTRTNIRELEGSLARLIAWCDVNHAEITLESVQECLKLFMDTRVRKVSIDAIQKAVAEQFGMRVSELRQKSNERKVAVPRQIAMYLAKRLTDASMPEIGRQFSGKHHTTVMHSIRKIDEQRKTDNNLNQTLNRLQERLSR
jgi:chromosomal replication initiator protein